ncbi:tryptophan RNA-binding attenuator protein-like domain-containing protein [Fomitopsis betulina]|nr:tryptophan RNA-binding attenuator protein-like domain-containing protein [Fomitopsis betulina]
MLYMRIPPGYEVLTKPGSLVSMDPTVQVKGKMNFGWKKLFTGGEITFAHFSGPGEVVVAPQTWGDVAQIEMDGSAPWCYGKHAFLACTPGIHMTTKSQGFGKALFSGDGLFVGVAEGAGVLFVHGMGAVIARQLQPGEQWVVNNDHLVAWNCHYKIETIQAGSLLSKLKTDEGLVCRCEGPGTVYIQSRSPEHLIHWIDENLPSRSN